MKNPIDQAIHRNNLYGTSYEPTYDGALSFMRRKYTRELKGVDVAVTGIPFDSATTNRPGASLVLEMLYIYASNPNRN